MEDRAVTGAIEALRWVQIFAYPGLGLICLRMWMRHRTAAAGWVAATFGSLGLVTIVGAFAGTDAERLPLWAIKALIAVLLLFPYCLHRFMSALVELGRWMRWVAFGLTAAVVLWSLAVPSFPGPGEPVPGYYAGFVVAVLVQWTVLSVSVSLRLWRAGRGQAGPARRRMRFLAMATVGLNLAVVVSASTTGEPAPVERLITQIIGLVGAGLFYVAFAPPRSLRMVWRRREDEALQRAAVAVSAATSLPEVTGALLPHIAPIFGGRGAVLTATDGTPVGTYGLTASEAEHIGRALASGGIGAVEATVMALPLRSGWLAVQATPYTPFFGRDELDLLTSIGAFVDLAVDRANLFEGERHAREQLQEANEELESFLYSVSHDLKSPLISLSGYLGYLIEDYGEAVGAGGREYLERMAANAGYMQNLIQDLLELSRVGRIMTEPSEIDLPLLVEGIASEIRRSHEQVGIEIGRLPVVLMNPLRAQQLFTNLLENAVRHCGRPEVNIRVQADDAPDGSVEISVSDDGVGIPQVYREKVFGVFERLEGRAGNGTGIGLAICRKIVENTGGRIWIGSSDSGTDIRMSLPARIVHGWHTAEVST